jgi:aminopeptidase N
MKTVGRILLLSMMIAPVAVAQRLGTEVLPNHYELRFNPDLEKATFAGAEQIDVDLKKSTSSITLHAADLTVSRATVLQGKTRHPATVTFKPRSETMTLHLKRPLRPGAATIGLDFKGTLNDSLRGLYLAKVGSRRYATTQFEPTDARRAFPSFDEPDMKATFDISVVTDRRTSVISNSRVQSDEPEKTSSKHVVTFERTPKMSTYLVAVAVGEFECSSGSMDGTPIRVCTTPGKKQLTSFALEAAESFLHYYNGYFSTPYPYGKLDLVGIPDFEAGAMENVGAIFYRESALLLDEPHASLRAREDVAETIAHEMAHMWFGDLVTTNWWNDLWLNEGFATWMSSKPVEAWKPEWKVELGDQESIEKAFNVDVLKSTRPIRARADTYDEINEMFDAITYDKGGAVIRMVENFVGPEAFRAGVNRYLTEHAYGNASAEDFWNTIEKVSGKPVSSIMKSFVDQPGVPLLSAVPRCQDQTGSLELTQRRFFANPTLLAQPSDQQWTLPVCLRSGAAAGTGPCVVMSSRQQKLPIACDEVPFLNMNGGGYYVTEYPAPVVQRLAARISTLTPEERMTLVRDEWMLVQAGRAHVGEFLDLAASFRQEHEPAVFDEVAGKLAFIANNLVAGPDRDAFRARIRALFAPLAGDLGWQAKPEEGDRTRALRASVIATLADTGRDPETLTRARSTLRAFVANPSSGDPTLAKSLFGVAPIGAGPDLFDFYVQGLRQARSPDERDNFLYALIRFTDPALLQRALDFAISAEVPTQDSANLIARAFRNADSREVAWQWLESHWDAVRRKTSTESGTNLVAGTGSLCSSETAGDVKRFFAAHPVAASTAALARAEERIRTCVALREAQAPSLRAWLTKDQMTTR